MPNQQVINGLQDALDHIQMFENQELHGELAPANINDIAMLIGQTNILLTHILKQLLKQNYEPHVPKEREQK